MILKVTETKLNRIKVFYIKLYKIVYTIDSNN